MASPPSQHSAACKGSQWATGRAVPRGPGICQGEGTEDPRVGRASCLANMCLCTRVHVSVPV